MFVSALVSAAVGAVVFLAPWPRVALRRVFGHDVERRLERGLARPLLHPPDSTRRFFLGALRRGVAAPFHRVIMIDFFLMDQIVSQTAALRDAATVALRAVVPSMARHAPLVALLPGWLRLAQCLRRRRDDGQRVHLINAGKYLAGLVATSCGLIVWYEETAGRVRDDGVIGGHVVRDPSAWRLLYNATTYAATAYGLFWDFFMDWSVFSVVERRSTDRAPKSRDRSFFRSLRDYRVVAFRRRLMIRERWKYRVAVAFNLLTRNAWILASVPLAGARAGAVGDEIWITVYAAVEVCRRCYWNYFRVENEHTTNCGKFRATTEIPLPFRDGELTDDDEDENDDERDDGRGGNDASRNVASRAGSSSRRVSSSGFSWMSNSVVVVPVRRRTRRRTNRDDAPPTLKQTRWRPISSSDRSRPATTTRATTNTRDRFGSTMSTRTRTRRRATWRWGPRPARARRPGDRARTARGSRGGRPSRWTSRSRDADPCRRRLATRARARRR